MHTYPLKLVTIIAEPVLELRLATELRGLGATGFTVVEGRGEGAGGWHPTAIPGVNIRVETIVSSEVADRIVEHLAARYFDAYAVIAYVSDIAVVRGAKYVSPSLRTR